VLRRRIVSIVAGSLVAVMLFAAPALAHEGRHHEDHHHHHHHHHHHGEDGRHHG
jgi:hypothetical protein